MSKNTNKSVRERFYETFVKIPDNKLGTDYYGWGVSVPSPEQILLYISHEIALARADEAENCHKHCEVAKEEQKEEDARMVEEYGKGLIHIPYPDLTMSKLASLIRSNKK